MQIFRLSVEIRCNAAMLQYSQDEMKPPFNQTENLSETQVQPKKPKRPMRSFEAADDVNRMLIRAEKRHIPIVKICNEALRRHLTELGFSRKKDIISSGKPA